MSQGAIIAVSILSAVLCSTSSLSSVVVSMGGEKTPSSTGPSTPGPAPTPGPTPTPAPTPTPTPAPTPAPTPPSPVAAPPPYVPPPPPTSLSYFSESCADLGGGSDIVWTSGLEDCASKCKNGSHGHDYTCHGFIYGASYDGWTPFCRVYNNKDLDHGTNICPSGIKSYTQI